MNWKNLLVIVLLVLLSSYNSSAQGLFNKLKQKARQIGETVVDRAVDDVLNGSKQPVGKDSKSGTSQQGPAKTEPYPESDSSPYGKTSTQSSVVSNMIKTDTIITGIDTVYHFNTSTVSAKDFVSYAVSLKGTPYVYGSSDPIYGVDCSGFITHVFNHFNIAVPRRTYDFKNAERKISVKDARPGDLILFTGPDASTKLPGHMGIVTARGKEIQFIHASSGKINAVTMDMLSNNYFKSRFLEIVRVF